MTFEFILSQAFVLVAIVFCIISYFTKNRNLILVCRIMIALGYACSYIILVAYAAVVTNLFAIIRCVILYIYARKDKDCPLWLFLVFEAVIVGLSIATWAGAITLLVMFGNLLDCFVVWQKNVKLYRWLSLPISLCFGFYNLYYGSYLAVALEIVVLIVKIVSVIEYYLSEKDKVNKV